MHKLSKKQLIKRIIFILLIEYSLSLIYVFLLNPSDKVYRIEDIPIIIKDVTLVNVVALFFLPFIALIYMKIPLYRIILLTQLGALAFCLIFFLYLMARIYLL
jgi:hypothetical protein